MYTVSSHPDRTTLINAAKNCSYNSELGQAIRKGQNILVNGRVYSVENGWYTSYQKDISERIKDYLNKDSAGSVTYALNYTQYTFMLAKSLSPTEKIMLASRSTKNNKIQPTPIDLLAWKALNQEELNKAMNNGELSDDAYKRHMQRQINALKLIGSPPVAFTE
jgi:hypothetical protein